MKKVFVSLLFIVLFSNPFFVMGQVNVNDSLALVDFYDTNDGDNWEQNFRQNWKITPVAQWSGIYINNARVSGITMWGNHKADTIPPSFASLDGLKSISFIDNAFSDQCLVPIFNCNNLITLKISEYNIFGPMPSTIGNLDKLITIDFQDCPNFSGPLPASLGTLSQLKYFDIGYGMHSGFIPAEALSELSLEGFGLNNNLYTFKELEPLVQVFKNKNKESVLFYSPQKDIVTTQRNDELLVAAGGTASNNTYKWYRAGTGLVETRIGDSTYRPALPGTYYAEITNAVATQLTLKSLPLKAAAAMLATCPGAASAVAVSDITGATYQWQESVDSINYYNISNNANYSGVNTQMLQLINVVSAMYGHKYRCVTNIDTSTVFTVYFPNTWTGASSANWEDPANWSCGAAPDANTNVIINSGNVVLNSNVTIRSLSLANGVTFTVGAGFVVTIRP